MNAITNLATLNGTKAVGAGYVTLIIIIFIFMFFDFDIN